MFMTYTMNRSVEIA